MIEPNPEQVSSLSVVIFLANSSLFTDILCSRSEVYDIVISLNYTITDRRSLIIKMSFRRPPSDVDRMTSLRVGNLPFRAHQEVNCVKAFYVSTFVSFQDLLPLFEKYGDVGDIYLPVERGSGRSRGFAFVRYYDKRDAEVRYIRNYKTSYKKL